MAKVVWHLEVISWHCCSVVQVVAKLKLFHGFGIVASWLGKPRRICSHTLRVALRLSARLRAVVNADSGNVDGRHGLCAWWWTSVLLVKSSWSFVWLQELSIFSLRRRLRWCLSRGDAVSSEVQGCHQVSSVSCTVPALTSGCVCRDVLAAYSCQCPCLWAHPSSSTSPWSLSVRWGARGLQEHSLFGCSWCCVGLGVSCTCCRHSRAGTKLWHCCPFRRGTSEGVGSSIDLVQSHSLAWFMWWDFNLF